MSASDNDRAGDLLIQEVDEDLRREQYEKLWKLYGHWVIAAALAVVLIVAGYQGWQTWDHKQRQAESAALQAAQQLAEQGKTQDAMTAFTKLAADGSKGVALEAQTRRAELLLQGGDRAGAVAAYDLLAASSAPQLYRDLAVIKAAMLALDGGDASGYEPKLAGLANAANPWHAQASEALAMIALKKGDAARATELYKQLADDALAPEGLRGRAAEMLAALTQQQTTKPADKIKG